MTIRTGELISHIGETCRTFNLMSGIRVVVYGLVVIISDLLRFRPHPLRSPWSILAVTIKAQLIVTGICGQPARIGRSQIGAFQHIILTLSAVGAVAIHR